MSPATDRLASGSTEAVPASGQNAARRRHRRIVVVGIVLLILTAAAVGGIEVSGTTKAGAPRGGVVDNADPISLAAVARQNLLSQTNVSATLGYAGTYSVVNQEQGTLTDLPAVGTVISQGQVLYQVNGSPVVLLYGTTPAYRSLTEGASAEDVTGPDVVELNTDLVSLGYATAAEIPAGSDKFSWWTKYAVEKLQKALGVTESGSLTLGRAVFLPTPIRITTVSGTLGAPASTGQAVLTGTSTVRQVTIDLDVSQETDVKVGDKVAITLPTGQTTPGQVTSVGTVAATPQGGSNPTVTVEVALSEPTAAGTLDQAPVQVSITTANADNALVVPVDALLARSEGGYAVEVVDLDGLHRLVDVSLGLADDADGLIQVTGAGLSAGQRVVVPAL